MPFRETFEPRSNSQRIVCRTTAIGCGTPQRVRHSITCQLSVSMNTCGGIQSTVAFSINSAGCPIPGQRCIDSGMITSILSVPHESA